MICNSKLDAQCAAERVFTCAGWAGLWGILSFPVLTIPKNKTPAAARLRAQKTSA
jgi:hypothetical protein